MMESFDKEVQVAEVLSITLNPDQLVIEGVTQILQENAERQRQKEFEYDDFMEEPN